MADQKKQDKPLAATDRRTGKDRRATGERRQATERRDGKKTDPIAVERRGGRDRRAKGPEGQRRKVERRINEYVLDPDVLEFINAVNEFKSVHQKPFPTWSDIYQIFVSLGYAKRAK
ncbi:MAG: hypothetical protein ACYSX0_15860 [Planctomycetota bacterium]|jgi:hypothetical protein